MAGKGQRRREKNYNAAHGGGNTRLPPPPDPSSADAVPSKLRKIMSLAGAGRRPVNRPNRITGNGVDKGINSGEGIDSMTTGTKRKRSDQSSNAAQQAEHQVGFPQIGMSEKKKKKKRKFNKAVDLRFEAIGETAGGGSKRKERKKQFLEERKKKKHKRSKTDDDVDFAGREKIRFGDVVQAPPKLAVPKAFKTTHSASQERIRLQAVDAYRERKGWASRPGVKLPSPMTTSPL